MKELDNHREGRAPARQGLAPVLKQEKELDPDGLLQGEGEIFDAMMIANHGWLIIPFPRSDIVI